MVENIDSIEQQFKETEEKTNSTSVKEAIKSAEEVLESSVRKETELEKTPEQIAEEKKKLEENNEKFQQIINALNAEKGKLASSQQTTPTNTYFDKATKYTFEPESEIVDFFSPSDAELRGRIDVKLKLKDHSLIDVKGKESTHFVNYVDKRLFIFSTSKISNEDFENLKNTYENDSRAIDYKMWMHYDSINDELAYKIDLSDKIYNRFEEYGLNKSIIKPEFFALLETYTEYNTQSGFIDNLLLWIDGAKNTIVEALDGVGEFIEKPELPRSWWDPNDKDYTGTPEFFRWHPIDAGVVDGLLTELAGIKDLAVTVFKFTVNSGFRKQVMESIKNFNFRAIVDNFIEVRKELYTQKSVYEIQHQSGKDVVSVVSIAMGVKALAQVSNSIVSGAQKLMSHADDAIVKLREAILPSLAAGDDVVVVGDGVLAIRKGASPKTLFDRFENPLDAKSAAAGSNAGKAIDDLTTSNATKQKIKDYINSKNQGTKFEGETAQKILDEGVEVKNFGTKIKDINNNVLGELDIELKNIVIECKRNLGSYNDSDIINQINRLIKYSNKEIIIYSGTVINYNLNSTKSIINYINSNQIKCILIDDMDKLIKIIK